MKLINKNNRQIFILGINGIANAGKNMAGDFFSIKLKSLGFKVESYALPIR